jgi:hypothetical protein
MKTAGAVGVGLLCAGALALRTYGLQFGLPAVYNPDEVAIMARALSFAKGTLNPHNFLYPTFYFYVLFAWVGAYLAFLWGSGRVESIAALQKLYFTDPTSIYTAGRALGVVSGTATVWLLYRLAGRIGGRRTALAAAVFLAVSPLHVRDSHYVKHDVPATLAIVAAYVAMLRLWPESRVGEARSTPIDAPPWRDAAIAGAMTGTAFSTHYYCIFLALPLAWAIIVGTRRFGPAAAAHTLTVAAIASAVTFFALSPFILAEPLTALRDIAANRAIVVDRAVSSGAFGPAARYGVMLWRDTVGMPVVLLAVIGIAWMLAVEWRRAVLLLAFPVPFLLFIANTASATRYLNPVLPFLAIFAAWALTRLGIAWRASPAVFGLAVAVAAAPATVASVRTDRFLRQDDTRTLALRYIESNIPAGSGILIQPYSVPLTMSRAALQEALARHLGDAEAASTKFQLQLSLDPYPSPAYRLIYLGSGGLDVDKQYMSVQEAAAPDGLAALRRLGVAFVVVKRYNTEDPDWRPLLEALAREGRRIAAFSPYRAGVTHTELTRVEPFLHNTDTPVDAVLERPGPPLEIWQLDDSSVHAR